MPSLPVLALMVILPLLLIGATLLVCRNYCNHMPRYGRRKILPVTTLRRISAKPEWVRQEIIKLKAQGPDLGCRHIAMIFNRRYAANGMTVGKTFVSGVIRKHHYDIQVIRQKLRRRKLTAGPKNRVWGLDLTGKTDDQGQLHSILGILDHGTRANLTLDVLQNKFTATLLRALANCIEHFGKPQSLRTDNEAMFRSWLFRISLWVVGIRHQRIEPHCPWQNGRIERFFGTLKSKLDRWAVDDLSELSTSLQYFRLWYNHVRPHQNLQGNTPAEVWSRTDIHRRHSQKEYWFEAWNGLLTGYYLPA
jgi:putative transposase